MTHQLTTPLAWIEDPGHAWLKVPLLDIAFLEIEQQISSYSFIAGQFVYLEEDCDATVYFLELEKRGLPKPQTRIQHVEHFSRAKSRFGQPQFDADFWNGLREGLQDE